MPLENKIMQTASSRSTYPSSPGIYNLTTDTAAGDTVQYTLRIPDAYDGQTALPVILCLHFGGEASDFYGRIFLELIPGPGLEEVPAFLVAPTTHTRDWATSVSESVAWAAVEEVERSLPVETGKRVVMGYSMGGRGTWHFAAAFRDRFVAAIPIAGRPGAVDLKALGDLPLYVIHSEADRVVPIEDALRAVQHLRDMKAPVTFAALPEGDHFDYRLVVDELDEVASWLEQIWSNL
jgi:predicted peptidase